MQQHISHEASADLYHHSQGAPDTVENYVMLSAGLDRFGRDTNGQPLPEDQVRYSPTRTPTTQLTHLPL